jgi:hypothetical protein
MGRSETVYLSGIGDFFTAAQPQKGESMNDHQHECVSCGAVLPDAEKHRHAISKRLTLMLGAVVDAARHDIYTDAPEMKGHVGKLMNKLDKAESLLLEVETLFSKEV